MTGRRLSLEWLEPRQLLAAIAVESTAPANGTSIQSPPTLTITFNQDVFQNSFGPWEDGDVQLEEVDDGSTTPVFNDPNNYPVATGDGDNVIIPIPAGQTLTPGTYNIVLVHSVWGADSPIFDQVAAGVDWNPNDDYTLASFTVLPPPVVQPPVTRGNASPLGTIGTNVQSIAGSLDLSSQENVDLYRFTLGSGHFWRLGVELDAQRIGSRLRGALSLFDSNGDVLATYNAGTGRPDFPADPYLFRGLIPGVYYIGVSGADNLPGQTGGYDPVAGTIGTSGSQQAGGKYVLDLVADPADTPTRVLGVGLQWGDPLGTSPTGLVLAFSGPIDVNSLHNAVQNHSALWAVDQSGHTWFLTPSSYQESLAQVGFVFDQPLPPGTYTLFNSSTEGLKDLAGWAAVAPGLPPDALATFTIPPSTQPEVPGNLGVLWPSRQNGVGDSELILPGQVVTSQVVVPVWGLYTLQTTFSQGTLAVERAGPDGLVVVDPGSQGTSHQYALDLEPGVYVFTFRNLGTQEVLAHWQFNPGTIDYEHQIDNGIGQSAALSLLLINPTSSSLTTGLPPGLSVSPAPDSTGPVSAPAPLPEAAGPSTPGTFTLAFLAPTLTSLSTSSVSVSPLSGSLFVTVNSGLLGAPTDAAGPIEAVGPTVPGGMIASAYGAQGQLPGIAGRWYGAAEDRDPTQSVEGPLTKGLPAAVSGLAATEVDPSPSSPGDLLALNKADRITELASQLGRWFGLNTGEEGATVGGDLAAPDLLARSEAEAGRGPADRSGERATERMTEADLGMPTGLIVVAAAAYRLRQLAGRWWRRSRCQVRVSSQAEARPPGPRSRNFRGSQGSHAAATFVRASRRRCESTSQG